MMPWAPRSASSIACDTNGYRPGWPGAQFDESAPLRLLEVATGALRDRQRTVAIGSFTKPVLRQMI